MQTDFMDGGSFVKEISINTETKSNAFQKVI